VAVQIFARLLFYNRAIKEKRRKWNVKNKKRRNEILRVDAIFAELEKQRLEKLV